MIIRPQPGASAQSVPSGSARTTAAGGTPPGSPRSETLETRHADTLRAVLSAGPEMRPSEVARALVWAKDPDYPPLDALNNIASRFLADAIRHL